MTKTERQQEILDELAARNKDESCNENEDHPCGNTGVEPIPVQVWCTRCLCTELAGAKIEVMDDMS